MTNASGGHVRSLQTLEIFEDRPALIFLRDEGVAKRPRARVMLGTEVDLP